MKIKHLKVILNPSVKENTNVNDLFGGNINSVPDRIVAVNRILDAY
ncbi:hypothetical protein [Maribacter aquivivus]|nr:hypothetical protein [Maribacter aquivivus]